MISAFCNWRDYRRALAVFGLKEGGFNQKVTSAFFSLVFSSKGQILTAHQQLERTMKYNTYSQTFEPTTSKEMVPFSLVCFGASFFLFFFFNFTDDIPVKDWNKMTIKPIICTLSLQTCLYAQRWEGFLAVHSVQCSHIFIQMAGKTPYIIQTDSVYHQQHKHSSGCSSLSKTCCNQFFVSIKIFFGCVEVVLYSLITHLNMLTTCSFAPQVKTAL